MIVANRAELLVRTTCKTLKVSASGFYGWLERPMCQRQQANVALTAQIREAFVASDETYGMPRSSGVTTITHPPAVAKEALAHECWTN